MCCISVNTHKLKYLGSNWKKWSFVKNQCLCFIYGILTIPLGLQGLPQKQTNNNKKQPSEINIKCWIGFIRTWVLNEQEKYFRISKTKLSQASSHKNLSWCCEQTSLKSWASVESELWKTFLIYTVIFNNSKMKTEKYRLGKLLSA